MLAAEALRALRLACGLGQEQWAAFVGVGRKTVQRWESGMALPDARAEAAILQLCAEHRVADDIDLPRTLAEARLQRHSPAPVRAKTSAPNAPLGRAADTRAVAQALEVSRLVTLVGPAGVGKTTLALAVAGTVSRRPPLATFLAPVPDERMVLSSIAATLSLRQTKARSLRDTVVAGLEDAGLLVLDNCEHLPAIGDVVDDLLWSCPGLRMLATSRTALRRLGEHVFTVEPLASAAAVELFERVAASTVRDVALTERDRAIVVQLCDRVDRLPLAIELLASRIRVAALASLLTHIDRRIELLRTSTTVPEERHTSLEAALAWSYDLLDERQQRLFRSLGVFAGRFTLDGAAAVTGTDVIETMDALEVLLEHHLVTRVDPAPRFAMLQTVRSFALEHLGRSGESDRLAASHAVYHAKVAASEAELLRGPELTTALRRLAGCYEDLRSALIWLSSNDPEAGLQLAVAMAPYWDATSALTEARSWLTDPGLLHDAPWFWRASARTWASYFAALQGDADAADRLASASLRLWDEHHLDAGRGYALLMLAHAAIERADLQRGETLLQASAEAFDRGGDHWGRARPLNNLGELARMRGDLDTAERLHGEALAIVRDIEDLGSQPNMLCGLGHVKLAAGEAGAARELAREAIEISEAIGNRLGTASALEVFALATLPGDRERAAYLLGAATVLRERLGAPVEIRDRQVIAEATALLDRSDAWRVGSTAGIDDVLRTLPSRR